MTIGEFITEHCYDGQELRITGIGPEAEVFFEGQDREIDKIPEDILNSEFAFTWAADNYVLVLECDYEGSK